MGIVRIFLILSLLLLPDTADACGWWGDGEVFQGDEDIIAPDGQAVEQNLNIKSMKLPGKMGFGIAVPKPGMAMPYLLATFGQPVTRISEFKFFGFRSVIDLGTPPEVAEHHRLETEAAGIKYFNIHIKNEMPDQQQLDRFKRIVLDVHNTPLLVYAPRASLIGVMWTSYRLGVGAPMDYSLSEGYAMGLTLRQGAELRKQLEN